MESDAETAMDSCDAPASQDDSSECGAESPARALRSREVSGKEQEDAGAQEEKGDELGENGGTVRRRARELEPQTALSASSALDVEDGPEDIATATVKDRPSESEVGNLDCGGQSTEDAHARREQILLGIVRQLRVQALEERSRAHDAAAKVLALEESAREVDSSKDGMGKPQGKFKQALQLEKQRSREMRKKRHQEAQVLSVQQKTDRALLEALEIREKAEAEAIAAKARHLAEAEVQARLEAEALARAEVAKVQIEVEELMHSRLNEIAEAEAAMKAQIQAELEAIRMQAEIEASVAKARAEEAKAQAHAELHAMKVRAEVEARVIKARAEAEVQETLADMEAKKLARQQAEAEELRAQAHAAAEAEQRAKVGAQRGAAALLRQAKELELKRVPHFLAETRTRTAI